MVAAIVKGVRPLSPVENRALGRGGRMFVARRIQGEDNIRMRPIFRSAGPCKSQDRSARIARPEVRMRA